MKHLTPGQILKNGNGNDFSKYFNVEIDEDNKIINGETGMTWGEFETKAMVNSSKNDPSVIMWSIGNEIFEGIGGDSSELFNNCSRYYRLD